MLYGLEGVNNMTYVYGFIFCGTICLLGQWFYDHTKLTPGHITSLFVVLGTFTDFFDIYDRLLVLCGAGAALPITSFGHSLVHGALSQVEEFGILGIPIGIFDLTAPGISTAIFFSFLIAILCKPHK